jgi:hypothetical protein
VLMTRKLPEELEARVGIEPTYKGFADPLIALLSFSESTHATLESELCPLFVHLLGEINKNCGELLPENGMLALTVFRAEKGPDPPLVPAYGKARRWHGKFLETSKSQFRDFVDGELYTTVFKHTGGSEPL